MEKVQRFADLSREEIAGLIDGKDSKNTQLVTKTALNTFRAFCGEKHPDKTQDLDASFANKLVICFPPVWPLKQNSLFPSGPVIKC